VAGGDRCSPETGRRGGWPPNSTAILAEGDSSGGKMLDSVNKVERYRKEANRCAELAKEASPPFLAEIYRKVAVRYVDPITPPALMMINRTKSWEVLKRAPRLHQDRGWCARWPAPRDAASAGVTADSGAGGGMELGSPILARSHLQSGVTRIGWTPMTFVRGCLSPRGNHCSLGALPPERTSHE
jgi:hypothetical protein